MAVTVSHCWLLKTTSSSVLSLLPRLGHQSPHIQGRLWLEFFVKLNVELGCCATHVLVASRDWWGLRKEMRGGLHMVPW